MAKPVLDGLFEINEPHQLRQRSAREADTALPYRAIHFEELDEWGHLVSHYRYWEAADGLFYGAERYSPSGELLDRNHRSRPEYA